MKVQVRQGVFETNSSSTHAVSVCTLSEWEEYRNGKLWLNMSSLKFLPEDDAKLYNADKIAEAKARTERCGCKFDIEDYSWKLYHSYDEEVDMYYEWFNEKFTLPNNQDVVAFGYYGHDY
jgi:hypothetical protein